jgi:phosphoenolpyruvate carboxylase
MKTGNFEDLVVKRFSLFNSLFLSLPFQQISKTGMMLPLLAEHCKAGLDEGLEPKDIINSFFDKHSKFETKEEQFDFLFRIIQYVERQIVLFDSVEDAAFVATRHDGNRMSLSDFVNMMVVSGRASELNSKLSEFSARIVFTAHPTQFYPLAVLDLIRQLRGQILGNDIQQIELSLQQLGMTPFSNAEKPSPLDEAKTILYYFKNVYYDAVADFFAEIREKIPGNNFNNYNLIKLGFWPGGDRDGNPFVTAETTLRVADELRMTLMQCYYRDIETLSRKITFRKTDKLISQLKSSVYEAMFDPEHLLQPEDLIQTLNELSDIIARDYTGLHLGLVDNLLTKVNVFKTHFATLDIRQHHDVHRRAVEAILKQNNLISESIAELTDDELVEILTSNNLSVETILIEDELIRDTVATIRLIPGIQKRNGEDGCNRYIISNSEDIFSVLFVFGLLRWCNPETPDIKVDVIPLFESMDGMKNARSIMQRLFGNAAYRRHLENRNNRQTMMLGFSDGTKDGGYLKANWSIWKAKTTLSAVCEEFGVKAIFFDGRGGPPARGGGKTHQFYASQSKEIANHEIQLTIQGQTISSRFGTKEHFNYNAEQLITAALSHHINGQRNIASAKTNNLMDELSELSFESYNSLKKHPSFIPYLENKSTLRFYSAANIGSRPAKRGKDSGLTLNDLRAISFVGSWSQLKQNVPGYFGIGTALKTVINADRLTELQQLFTNFPFFRNLILNSMMSMSKSNFALTAYMATDDTYAGFWTLLRDEFILSKDMSLQVSEYEVLMQEEPLTRRSIEVRESIVLPLLVIQQYALQHLETENSNKEVFEKMVTRSLYGNINASRNSA